MRRFRKDVLKASHRFYCAVKGSRAFAKSYAPHAEEFRVLADNYESDVIKLPMAKSDVTDLPEKQCIELTAWIKEREKEFVESHTTLKHNLLQRDCLDYDA